MKATDLIAQARAATLIFEGRALPLDGATVTLGNGTVIGVALVPAIGRRVRRASHKQARFYVNGKHVPRAQAEAELVAGQSPRWDYALDYELAGESGVKFGAVRALDEAAALELARRQAPAGAIVTRESVKWSGWNREISK